MGGGGGGLGGGGGGGGGARGDISEVEICVIDCPAALVLTGVHRLNSSFATNTLNMHVCFAIYTHAACSVHVLPYVWSSVS